MSTETTELHRRAGDTEPLQMTLSATDLTTLSGATILAYVRAVGASTNHVNGVACTVVSGLTVQLDPVDAKNGGGNAFDAAGTYIVHLKVTQADADIGTFPQAEADDVRVIVDPVFW